MPMPGCTAVSRPTFANTKQASRSIPTGPNMPTWKTAGPASLLSRPPSKAAKIKAPGRPCPSRFRLSPPGKLPARGQIEMAHAQPEQTQWPRNELLLRQKETSQPVNLLGGGDRFLDRDLP